MDEKEKLSESVCALEEAQRTLEKMSDENRLNLDLAKVFECINHSRNLQVSMLRRPKKEDEEDDELCVWPMASF